MKNLNTIPLDDVSFEWCLGKPCGFITKKEKNCILENKCKRQTNCIFDC